MISTDHKSVRYSIFVQPTSLLKTDVLTLLCDIFVLANVLVIKPLLYMYIDNISTLTSDMTSLVYTATYIGERNVGSVFATTYLLYYVFET